MKGFSVHEIDVNGACVVCGIEAIARENLTVFKAFRLSRSHACHSRRIWTDEDIAIYIMHVKTFPPFSYPFRAITFTNIGEKEKTYKMVSEETN